MINKKIFISFAFIFLVLIMSFGVFAIGISPGRTTIDFEPGLEKEVTLTLYNEQGQDTTFKIYVRGELSNYIHINEKFVRFAKGEKTKVFTYKIKLPNDLPPGVRTARLVAMEIIESTTGNNFVGATVAVATEMKVVVPTPGKYIESSISFLEANKGQPMSFFISISNIGTENIANANAIIDIISLAGEKIATIKTNSLSIKTKTGEELIARWIPGVNPGKYIARVSLLWDEGTTYFEKEFNVGEMKLELKEVFVRDFKLGEIAKFEILVYNKWGEDIQQAYAEITMKSGPDIISQFKSSTESVPTLETKALIAYWDTVGINPGEYISDLRLNYDGKSSNKKLGIKISLNKIEFEGYDITAAAISSDKKGSLSLLFGIGVIVLILINVGWFIYFKKRKKQKEKNKKTQKNIDEDDDW